MAKSIPDLPHELIVAIVENFHIPPPTVFLNREDDFDRTHGRSNRHGYIPEERADLRSNFLTLCRLSLVSIAFNQIAEEVLYRTYPGPALVDPNLFLAALAARPHRTNFVQCMLASRRWGSFWHWSSWERIEVKLPEQRDRGLQNELGQSRDGDARPWPEYRDLTVLRMLDAQARWRMGARALRLGDNTDEALEGVYSGLGEEDYKNIIKPIVLPSELSRSLREPVSYLDMTSTLIAIVMACPNIHHLLIDRSGESCIGSKLCKAVPHILPADARGIPRTPPKHLSLASKADFPRYPSLDQVARQWQGSSIQSLSLHAHCVKGTSSMEPRLRLDSIAALHLTRCPVDRAGIRHIFGYCPSLTRLSIVAPEEPYVTMSMADIGHALREFGTNLTHLTVAWLDWSASSWPYWQMRENDKYPPTKWDEDPPVGVEGMGSLRELSNLRELTITIWELLGIDIVMDVRPKGRHLVDLLPTSLTKVTILGCNEEDPGKVCAATNEELWHLMRNDSYSRIQVIRADMPEKYVCNVGSEWKHTTGPLDQRFDCGHGHVRHTYWRVDL